MSRFEPGPRFDESVQLAAQAGLEEVAEEGARRTRLAVDDDTGHYRRSVTVFDDSRGVGWQSDDAGAVAIEYGAVQAPAQAPIRRGASDVGGKFEPR